MVNYIPLLVEEIIIRIKEELGENTKNLEDTVCEKLAHYLKSYICDYSELDLRKKDYFIVLAIEYLSKEINNQLMLWKDIKDDLIIYGKEYINKFDNNFK